MVGAAGSGFSTFNTSSYVNMYKESAVSNTISANGSFAQCIQTASESQKESENLSNELKKATSGMSACGKCGAMYMGQEPPPVCGKCGYEDETNEDTSQNTEEVAKTDAVSETGLNSNSSIFSGSI